MGTLIKTETSRKAPKKTAVAAAKRDVIEETRARAKAVRTARVNELVALIRRRMSAAVEAFYDVGVALIEIVDERLYLAAGHKNLDTFLRAHKLMARTQAFKLMAVARSVPREEALRIGLERSYALMAYTKETPEPDSPASLVEAGATFGGKPVISASRRAIDQKRREVHDEKPKSKATSARDALREKGVRWLTASLKRAGLKGAVITSTRSGARVEWSHETLADLSRKR